MAQKRSFTETFLQEQETEDRASKKATRIELVRAQSRRDSAKENMQKCKERAGAILDRMREHEAAFEAAKEDVARSKALPKDDN